MMKRALLIAMLVTGVSTASLPAWGITAAEAMAAEVALREAMKLRDYAAIYMIIKPQASDGKADAQYLLGRLYFNGKGVEQDYGKASYWLQQSAGQGYAPAQNFLSIICSRKPTFCQ